MATKIWKGMLQFGLVSIPVYLNVAARSESVSLNTFHSACGSRIKMPKFCPVCNVQPPETELCKGYDTGDGFVELRKEEIEAIMPASDKVLEINECVKWADVDPVYLAESFYVLPEDTGKRGYALLVRALQETGRVAIAQLTKNSRENILLLRPRGNGLVGHFLYYPNEVNAVPEFDALKLDVSAADLKLAAKLVDSLADSFKPEQYENGYVMRLNALIASKLDKKSPAPTPIRPIVPRAMDMTAALEASLSNPRKRRISLTEEQPAPEKAARGKAKKARKAA